MNAKVGNSPMSHTVAPETFSGVLSNPTIPAQNLPGGDLRLPISALNAPVRYTVPAPSEVQEPYDSLLVFLLTEDGPDEDTLVDMLPLGPIADRTWPMEFFIPLDRLVELDTPETPTKYRLVYILWSDGDNPGEEYGVDYIIDRTAPYKTKSPVTDFSPLAPEFPADLPPTQFIDLEYTSSHPDGVVVTLADYVNYDPSDVCFIYWGKLDSPNYSTPVLSEVPVPPNKEITLPIGLFEGAEEGLNTLQYLVRDLAGNFSKMSRGDQRRVQALVPPVPTLPVVPLADGTDGDTLIDLADCNQGVTVEITVPQPSSPNDMILVTWGGEPVNPPQRVGDDELLVFPVDYEVIKRAYGPTDGEVNTTVAYTMLRGSGVAIAEGDVVIQVDISYTGPVNPNEPDPVNPDLNFPRLVSSTDVNNELGNGDHGEDANIFIRLYDAPPTAAGQIVTAYYDDTELEPYYLSRGQEGDEIGPIQVPWSLIERKLNATVFIKWKINSVLGNNPMYSENQPVRIDITHVDLPKPVVQRTSVETGRISCPTLNFIRGDGTVRRNLTVVIPFSAALVPPRTVTLHWGGFTDAEATIPIAGTATSVDYTITGPVPPTGIQLFIGEYFTNFRPVSGGFGKLTYTVETITEESTSAIHGVYLTDGDLRYCEVANPIPTP